MSLSDYEDFVYGACMPDMDDPVGHWQRFSAWQQKIVDWLKGKGIEIIAVPFRDTMTLGCNVMALGADRVIAPKHSRVLIENLKARGFEVAEVDCGELSKTGGGIHCMAQALRRDPG